MENNQQTDNDKNRSLPWRLIPRTLFALFVATITPSIIPLMLTLVNTILILFSGGRIQQNGSWTILIGITLITLIISSLHVILLGIPAFIIGWYFRKIHWWTSIIVAFLIGAVPTAVFLWPLKHPELHSTSSRWDGEKMMQTMINGIPTFTGWTDWILAFTVMGLFGVGGGVVFWLVWKQHNMSTSSD